MPVQSTNKPMLSRIHTYNTTAIRLFGGDEMSRKISAMNIYVANFSRSQSSWSDLRPRRNVVGPCNVSTQYRMQLKHICLDSSGSSGGVPV